MKDSKKKIGLIALVFCIVSASIAFAAATGVLSITGNTTLKGGEVWNIGFAASADGAIGQGEVTANVSSEIEGTAPTGGLVKILAADSFGPFNVTLQKPGDEVTYDVYVKNDGKVSAKLTGYSIAQTTIPQELTLKDNELSYKITVDGTTDVVGESLNGAAASENDLDQITLAAGENAKVTISVKWNVIDEASGGNTVPDSDIQLTMGQIDLNWSSVDAAA